VVYGSPVSTLRRSVACVAALLLAGGLGACSGDPKPTEHFKKSVGDARVLELHDRVGPSERSVTIEPGTTHLAITLSCVSAKGEMWVKVKGIGGSATTCSPDDPDAGTTAVRLDAAASTFLVSGKHAVTVKVPKKATWSVALDTGR
jgi:hypothetical protein